MATVDDLFLVEEAFLSASIAALDAGPGAPARAFVAPGDPALDCCVAGDSMISTARGPVPIRDVVPDDYVWAFDDGYLVLRRVLRTIPRGTQPVVRIRGRRRQLVATEDHRVLRLRVRHARTRGGRTQEWSREWVAAGELARGDILVSLDHLDDAGTTELLPDGTPLSVDVAWLLGLWVGDGCFNSPNGLCWFVHNGVRAEAARVLKNVWGLTAREDSERLNANSRELHDLFSQVVEPVRAHEKRVPPIIWERDAAVRRAFLDGYAASDGHVDKRGYVKYATASYWLAAEVRMLHVGLGDAVSNLAVEERTQPITIRGRLVRSPRALHRFAVYPNSPRTQSEVLIARKGRRAIPDERLSVMTVSSVESCGETDTYDLTVDESKNFIAEGIVVHNCDQLTVHTQTLSELGLNAGIGANARAQALKRGDKNEALLVIEITRCIPVPSTGKNGAVTLPTPLAMQAAAQLIAQDGWALWLGLSASLRDGDLSEICEGAVRLGAQKLPPQGGCGGWIFTYQYPLGGGRLS